VDLALLYSSASVLFGGVSCDVATYAATGSPMRRQKAELFMVIMLALVDDNIIIIAVDQSIGHSNVQC
jgi:hypothetical protein